MFNLSSCVVIGSMIMNDLNIYENVMDGHVDCGDKKVYQQYKSVVRYYNYYARCP